MCLVYLSCILLAMHGTFQSRIFLVKCVLYFFIDSLSESSLFSYSPLILKCEAYSLTYLMFIVFQLWRFSAMFDTWATPKAVYVNFFLPLCVITLPLFFLCLLLCCWKMHDDMFSLISQQSLLLLFICLFSDLPGIILYSVAPTQYVATDIFASFSYSYFSF